MKKILICFALTLIALAPSPSRAHDEGHGPKLTDAAKFGGVISPVIHANEASKGAKAALVHKAELVRSEDGTVRVYLYDKQMNALDLSKFDKSANAVLSFKKSKKWVNTPFKLTQEEGAFIAKSPKAGAKPFNIDIHLNEAGEKLLVAFDNLD